MDTFTKHYLIAALWSSTDDEGQPLDCNHSLRDIAPQTIIEAEKDCAAFIKANGIPEYHDSRYSDTEKAGHDFWLTRNRHGAGFWDRSELSPEDQKRLTTASHAFRKVDLYVGDDGLIYS